MPGDRVRYAQEALFCERVLAKSGTNVLLEALGNAPSVETFTHYPAGDVFDPESGAHWYYHSHPRPSGEAEHGHFHCFVRLEGAEGPVHHLVALGVDPFGRLLRLFTVNQWVTGDAWIEAGRAVALLPRFDVQLARPDYLVNRWLTAVVALYEGEIAGLIQAREGVIARHRPEAGGDPREDRALDVTSEAGVDLVATARALGVLPPE